MLRRGEDVDVGRQAIGLVERADADKAHRFPEVDTAEHDGLSYTTAPLRVAHGFGANLGPVVQVFGQPFLVVNAEMAEGVADALGDAEAVILQSSGMLAVGQSVPHACVQALFLEETAEVQLLAQAAGLAPRPRQR